MGDVISSRDSDVICDLSCSSGTAAILSGSSTLPEVKSSAPASVRDDCDVSEDLRDDVTAVRGKGEGGGDRRGVEAADERGDLRTMSSINGESVLTLDDAALLLCGVAMLPVGVVLDDLSPADDVTVWAERGMTLIDTGDCTGGVVSGVEGLKLISVVCLRGEARLLAATSREGFTSSSSRGWELPKDSPFLVEAPAAKFPSLNDEIS